MFIKEKRTEGRTRIAVRLEEKDVELAGLIRSKLAPHAGDAQVTEFRAELIEADRLTAEADRAVVAAQELVAQLANSREPRGLTLRLAEAKQAVAQAESEAKALRAAADVVRELADRRIRVAEQAALASAGEFVVNAIKNANAAGAGREVTSHLQRRQVVTAVVTKELGRSGPDLLAALENPAPELYIDDPAGEPIAFVRRVNDSGGFHRW